jgi:predicted membrane protein
VEPQRHDVAARVTPQVVFGFVVIALGIIFTLDNLHVIYAEDYLRYWPVALIAIGLTKIWQVRSGFGNPIAGFLFLLFGTWLLLNNLGYIHRDAWSFWPVILIFVGSMIMWQGMRGRRQRAGLGANDTINGVAVLSGVQRQSNVTAFRGGELTAFMGGCEIDLRKASINGDAVIDVFAMWGGIEIKVPETWTVINKVTPFMGGVEDKTLQPAAPSEHRLTLRGLVLMGGIEIKN